MFRNKIILSCALGFLLFFAAGLNVCYAEIVPCGNSGGSPCTLCHLIRGIQNLVNYGKNILVAVAIAGIVVAGLIYMISSGSETMITTAKNCFKASIVGFAITIAAWLIVNVTLTLLAAKNNLGIEVSGWFYFTCDTTSSATTSSSSSGTTASTQTAAKIAENLAECKKECSSKTGDELTACNTACEKAAEEATKNMDKTSSGTGSAGAVSSAQSMMGNCEYCNIKENSPSGCGLNGCSGTPPYTDCSNFVSTAYKNNGCTSPGNTTEDMYPKGQSVSDFSTLKAGDIIVTRKSSGGKNNHAVMCENDGCSTVIHASGQKDDIKESSSSYYSGQNAHVLSASDYCSS